MRHHHDPIVLRLCLAVVRLMSVIVPAASRRDWLAEWNAEVRCRWDQLADRGGLDWRSRMDLLRRAFGAFPDAAWLRRQFTLDADLVHDLRHGVRMLAKAPAFTASAVLILALGSGGTIAIVALLDTLFIRPLPYADAERIVTVWTRSASRPTERDDVAPADFLDWRSRAKSFSSFAALVPFSRDFTGGTEPEVFFGAQVSEGFFDAIGMAPMLGRGFLPEEHTAGGRKVVVIAHSLWQTRFAGDPQIINKTISLGNVPWTIVGVLPRNFAPQLLPRPGELTVWTPRAPQPYDPRIRASRWWNVVAKLAPGVSLAQAQSEMDAISAVIARENPRTNTGLSAQLVPMREHLMGGVSLPLMLMLGAVVLVLGIGCANVASLLLARGVERGREFAIRAALGAGRARLVRQLVAESLMLSAVAAAAGVGLAVGALRAIVALAPSGLLRLHDSSIDARMVAVAAALTAVTTIAFGLVSALQFSRRGGDALRERASSGIRSAQRRTLVVAEVAIALVLLAGAGLLVRSFERLLAVDPGFRAAGVVTAQVFAADRHRAPDRSRLFFTSVVDRIQALPGVEAAGAVSAMPFAMSNIDIRSDLEVVGRPAAAAGEQRGTYLTIATPGYFRAMSIPLRQGRFLEPGDSEAAPLVALVSDALRAREWPNESPIGRRIGIFLDGRRLEAEIVGVVGQIRHDGLDTSARSEVFLPHAQAPFGSMTFVARGAGDPAALIDRVKRQIWSVDPLQAIYDAANVERLVAASVVRQRFSMTVMSAFALIALALCAGGIYSIISFTTTQRTREIGVRMALGADAPAIRRMVLREGAVVILAGLATGLVGAFIASRFLQTLLFGVGTADPLTFGVVCTLLAGVGLAACYVPARRATRIDPLVALRVD
jgi:putative ABC transport system permease protein